MGVQNFQGSCLRTNTALEQLQSVLTLSLKPNMIINDKSRRGVCKM